MGEGLSFALRVGARPGSSHFSYSPDWIRRVLEAGTESAHASWPLEGRHSLESSLEVRLGLSRVGAGGGGHGVQGALCLATIQSWT